MNDSELVKHVLKQLGLSVGNFATLIGTSRTTVYNWINSDNNNIGMHGSTRNLITLLAFLIEEHGVEYTIDRLEQLQYGYEEL